MVLVSCLILCSKFAKKIVCRLGSAGTAGGAFSAPPDPLVGSCGREGKREIEGQEGNGREGGGISPSE